MGGRREVEAAGHTSVATLAGWFSLGDDREPESEGTFDCVCVEPGDVWLVVWFFG